MRASTDAMRRLNRAAPSFRPKWAGLLRRSPPPHDAVAELVEHHLRANTMQLDELKTVLDVAEAVLATGASDARDLVITGLLEDLLLLASYPDTALTPGALDRILPPRCAAATSSLNDKWTAVWHAVRDTQPTFSLDQYLGISNRALRRTFRCSCRLMPDGRLVSIADVIRWEASRGS